MKRRDLNLENIYIYICICPGLEPFCQELAVLKRFEAMATGRILLAEILERGKPPLVVLYDTSQDDDLNINAACIKALQDKMLASPLQVRERFVCTLRRMSSSGPNVCLSSGGQLLHERDSQQRLLRRDHLLSASIQRTRKAD